MFTVLLIAAVWVAVGAVLSLVMGRRGHNSFGWLVLGTVLGPLGLVLAADARRHDEDREPAVVPAGLASAGPTGPVDVLVGYDGSPESAAALQAAEGLLGDRIGRLVIATVVSFDVVPDEQHRAEAALRRLTAHAGAVTPTLEVLHGHPSAALVQRAVAGGFDLLAIGTRGRGLSKALMGSAASELARHCKVPVLVVGAGGAGP
ncbi:MAG: universal stress protein [Acidimicrobiales bacterium]